MRPLHSLLLLLTLAALGLVSWLLLSGADATGTIAAPLQEQPFVRPKPEQTQANLLVPGEDLADTNSERTELAPIVEPAPTLEVSSGRTISGTLTDTLGNALAGVRVLVAPQTGAGLRNIDLAEEGTMPWISREECETDGQGRFELSAPAGAGVHIAARMPGLAPFDGEFSVKRSESHDVGVIAMEASVVLFGRVVDANGSGIAEAELRSLPIDRQGLMVFSVNDRSGRLLATTDAAGDFRIDQLASGPYKIAVSAKAYPEATQTGITERPGEQVHGLRWQLQKGLTIQGRLAGAPEGRLVATWVRALPNGSGVGSQRTAEVRADGSFLLEGLLEGVEYRVSAREGQHHFWAPARSDTVTALAGTQGVVLQWRLESALVFRVVDSESGDPIEEFTVKGGIDWPAPLMDENGKVLERHPEGRVRFGGLQARQNGSRARLEIDAVGYEHFGRDEIALRAGEELELGTLRLQRVPLVRVRVVDDSTGKPIARARVTLREGKPTDGQDRSFVAQEFAELAEFSDVSIRSQTERTNEEGFAIFSSLPGTTCVVKSTHTSFADAERRGVRLPIGRDFELEVRMSAGGTVVVSVVDASGNPVARAGVEHRGPDSAGASTGFRIGGEGGQHTDADGKKMFEHLAPGLHRFRIGKSSGMGRIEFGDSESTSMSVSFFGSSSDEEPEETGWQAVEVVERETSELTLVAPAKGALFGKVFEEGKPLSGAKVRLEELTDGGFGGALFGLEDSLSTRTNGEGVFRIEGAEQGNYTVWVTHPSRVMPSEFEVELVEGENDMGTLDLVVCIVEGRVTNQAGEPLAGIRIEPKRAVSNGPEAQMNFESFVMIGSDGGAAMEFSSGSKAGDPVLTDADGRYRLRGVEPNQELIITATGMDLQPGQSEPFVLDPDEVRTNFDFVLREGGKLTVIVTRANGTSVGHCLVDAQQVKGEDALADPRHDVLGEGGRTTLAGLAPGTWSITVNPIDTGPGETSIPAATDPREVEVVAGETREVTMIIP